MSSEPASELYDTTTAGYHSSRNQNASTRQEQHNEHSRFVQPDYSHYSPQQYAPYSPYKPHQAFYRQMMPQQYWYSPDASDQLVKIFSSQTYVYADATYDQGSGHHTYGRLFPRPDCLCSDYTLLCPAYHPAIPSPSPAVQQAYSAQVPYTTNEATDGALYNGWEDEVDWNAFDSELQYSQPGPSLSYQQSQSIGDNHPDSQLRKMHEEMEYMRKELSEMRKNHNHMYPSQQGYGEPTQNQHAQSTSYRDDNNSTRTSTIGLNVPGTSTMPEINPTISRAPVIQTEVTKHGITLKHVTAIRT